MAIASPRPLLRTPIPYPGEGPFGFILRVSESNGYDTPYAMLAHAGLSQSQMFSIVVDTGKLEAILAAAPGSLSHLSYCSPDRPRGDAPTLCGQTVPNGAIRLKNPALCTHCVSERGYVEAIWDLQHLIVCPRHRCQLLDKCERCGSALSWFRPGLLRCQCGSDLVVQTLPHVKDIDVGLATILQSSLTGAQIGDVPGGLPVPDLTSMPLRSLLRLLTKLGRHNACSAGLNPDVPVARQVQNAAEVLGDWPNQFFRMLGGWGDRRADLTAKGLRKQFSGFFNSTFRSAIPAAELKFVKQAFVEFGLNHWGKALVDSKLLRDSDGLLDEAQHLSQSQVARRSGTTTHLLRRLRQYQLVATSELPGPRPTIIMNASKAAELARDCKSVMSRRLASSALGIPESVLQELRGRDVFRSRPLPRAKSIFHRDDVKAFGSLLDHVALTTNVRAGTNGCVTLRSVLQKVRIPVEYRAALVQSLLSGDVPIRHCTGQGTEHIWVCSDQVELLRTQMISQPRSHSFSASQAARIIGCSPTVLPALVSATLLDAIGGTSAPRYSEESVKHFGARFRTLAALAREMSTSTRGLLAGCSRLGIDLLMPARTGTGIVQPFISIADVHRLRSQVPKQRPKPTIPYPPTDTSSRHAAERHRDDG